MLSEVIILIPYYENELGLLNSIRSIREDFVIDLMIVDDGSKKEPLPINSIKEMYKDRGKVMYEILPKNQGVEIALNTGLVAIMKHNYPYIARLDCGDFFHKNKLKKQLNYLKKNKEIKLLGCWGNIKDDKNSLLYIQKYPVTHKEIKNKIYLNTTFIHPSVIFESSILTEIGLYPLNFPAAEDYAFFIKIVKKYRAENYPEVLLDYIIDPNSISSLKRRIQVKSRIKGILHNYYLGWYPSYGLIRNVILLFISRKMSNKIKSILKK